MKGNGKAAYKEIVSLIIAIEDRETYDKAYGSIGRAFEAEKITWADYEQLFDLLAKVGRPFGFNI